ncbi:fucosyltransferase 2-like [Phragmites australis]|uniref:fucosyltransferase 2-like n=1 Tax=Phragmites australis TaxID=29695 RepID=UPI002D795452|nr:fucosyltransferase 2-like [Phragmites australis]
MRQREAKVGVDGAAAPRKEQWRSAAGRWVGADEAALAFTHRTKRPRCLASNVVLVAFVMTVSAMVILLGARTSAPAVSINAAKVLRRGSGDGFLLRWPARSHDKLLGGLLAEGFDERSCHSRYQSAMYRRHAGRRPSPYLISKLRQREALQQRCGPGTVAYSNALEQLRSGKSGGIGSPDCKYLVSISYSGLGNRMLAAASAFLYALLTDRVLLVDPSNDMGELFCEPFPGTTWVLPSGFPLTSYTNFSVSTAESYGNMLKSNVIRNDDGDVSTAQLPVFAYVHLNHDATDHDKFFFCDEDQRVLRNIPWLVMRTDNYIVPGLFLVMGFQEELDRLFPEPDTVFHHLGRYLFHPNNHVWGLITRYYDAYLATAQQRVGIQVRVFGAQPNSPEFLEQITMCTQKQGLLPKSLTGAEPVVPEPSRKSKAVLVTSLKSWYYEKIKSMYWEHAAATGEAVSVHQPSHEEFQRFGAKSHDTMALAEIYLLSLTDALVTTGWSTFGYVAQGLGGLRPWVMYKPANETQVPDPPCGRDVSMEPCFHAPPFYDCRLKRGADTGKIVPQVQHCIDMSWGLKLVDGNS